MDENILRVLSLSTKNLSCSDINLMLATDFFKEGQIQVLDKFEGEKITGYFIHILPEFWEQYGKEDAEKEIKEADYLTDGLKACIILAIQNDCPLIDFDEDGICCKALCAYGDNGLPIALPSRVPDKPKVYKALHLNAEHISKETYLKKWDEDLMFYRTLHNLVYSPDGDVPSKKMIVRLNEKWFLQTWFVQFSDWLEYAEGDAPADLIPCIKMAQESGCSMLMFGH